MYAYLHLVKRVFLLNYQIFNYLHSLCLAIDIWYRSQPLSQMTECTCMFGHMSTLEQFPSRYGYPSIHMRALT